MKPPSPKPPSPKPPSLKDASQKTDEVIADYLQSIEAGDTPDREAILLEHPSVQSGLESFFSVYDLMRDSTRTQQQSFGSFEPGRHLGRHCLVRVIGSGTFGTVWLGFDSKLKRPVAIKVPNRDRFSSDQQRESFLSEARIVAQLEHPNIVPIYDVGETESGDVYLVSRFIAGENLACDMIQRHYSVVDTARCVAIVAQTLEYAHQQQLIHRDIKPSNIIIDAASRQPFVTDFGLAQENSPDSESSGKAGTPAYMSPEQASGEVLDGRSDVFSLGVVLYELLTGCKPFQGSDAKEYMKEILYQEPKPLRSHLSDLPDELQTICSKALCKSREDRYASADQLSHSLEHFVSTQPRSDLPNAIAHPSDGNQPGRMTFGSTRPESNGNERESATNGFLVRTFGSVILSVIGVFAISYSFLPHLFTPKPNEPKTESKPAGQRSGISAVEQPLAITGSDKDTDGSKSDTISLDRQIAIETLTLGGTVEFSDEDESFEISQISEMPRGPVKIEWIMLASCNQVDDEVVSQFHRLENLEGVDLFGTQITDAGLIGLAKSKTLTHVYVANTNITDLGASAITQMPKLKKVNFSDTAITSETIKLLSGNSNLVRLDLSNTRVDDIGMPSIGTLKNLLDLDLEKCLISGLGLQHLSKLLSLRDLELDGTNITPKSLDSLKNCPLTYIELPIHFSKHDVDRFLENHPNCRVVLE